MSFFIGKEIYSMDAKGRVNFPSKMRKDIEGDDKEKMVITRRPDSEKCLYVYPMDEWRNQVEVLRRLNNYREKDRFFIRTFLENAEKFELDSQARISISKELIEYADLRKDVLIIGAMDHIEIWNPESYEKYCKEKESEFPNVTDEVLGSR